MSEFHYSSIAEAHLGGDNFTTRSVRLDAGTGQAELAEVTATGRLINLTYARITGGSVPPLPRPPAPAGGTAGGPPPLDSEGMGAVGIAASGSSLGNLTVRRAENTDIRSTAPVAGWASYDAALRQRVGSKTGSGARGTYVQLSPLGRNMRAAGATPISTATIENNSLYAALFAAPFKFVATDGFPQADAGAVLNALDIGRPRVLAAHGQHYVLSRFRLN